MANTVDILLQIQADTANVTRAVQEARALAQAQKESTDAAKRQAAEVQAAADRAIAAEIRRKETAIEALEFQRQQIAMDSQGGAPRRVAAENALLERQARITQEIIAIKRGQMAGQDELQRANTLREIQRLEQGIATAARDTAKAQREAAGETQRFGSVAGSIARYAAGFIGIQQAVSFISSGIRNSLQLAETFKNTADRLDTTSEAVQVIDFAFRRGGLSINEATQAMYNFNRRLDEARTSTKAAEPFDKLGLSVERLVKLRPEYRLQEFGRALADNSGDAGALAAAVDILGNKSQRTFDVLKQYGTVGFDQLRRDAKDLNQLMDPEMVRRLEKAKQQMEDFGRAKDIALGPLAGEAADVITSMFGPEVAHLEVMIRRRQEYAEASRSAAAELRREGGASNARFAEEAEKRAVEYARQAEALQIELDMLRAERAPILAPIPTQTAAEINDAAIAGDVAAYAEQRALAEEQANRWLKENAEKLEEQNQALREATMLDEERLAAIGARLRTLDTEHAAKMAAAGSDAERQKLSLEYENARLKALKDYLALTEKLTAENNRAIESQRRADRDRIDTEIQRRETQIDQLQFERERMGDREDLSRTEQRERINELLEREVQLLGEIYNLQASIPAATEKERAEREAEMQATDQRIKTAIDANAPKSVDFMRQIELSDKLKDGVEGLSEALGRAAVGMGDLGEMASDVFADLAADIASATIKALVFESIIGVSGGPDKGLAGLLGLGFARGGYTGRGARHEVAGVVHRGEYVIPKDVVDRTGPSVWAGTVRSLRGYADGGLVGSELLVSSMAPRGFAGGLAGASGSATGRGASGIQVNFNFEAGVTKQELAALLPMIEERARHGVQDAIRRRKDGYR
jgi:hypothetical protein